MKPKVSILLFLLLPAIACGPKATPKYEYEIVNVDQIAIEEIEVTPTNFTLDNRKSKQAWERAQLFLEKYGSGAKYSIVARGDESLERLENRKDPAMNYKYRVERLREGEDYQYEITCVPTGAKADTRSASLNAKNLARFLKDGTLEVQQLAY